jgi:hypothetical protein
LGIVEGKAHRLASEAIGVDGVSVLADGAFSKRRTGLMKTWGPIVSGVVLVLTALARMTGNEDLAKALQELDMEKLALAGVTIMAAGGYVWGVVRKIASTFKKRNEALDTVVRKFQ